MGMHGLPGGVTDGGDGVMSDGQLADARKRAEEGDSTVGQEAMLRLAQARCAHERTYALYEPVAGGHSIVCQDCQCTVDTRVTS